MSATASNTTAATPPTTPSIDQASAAFVRRGFGLVRREHRHRDGVELQELAGAHLLQIPIHVLVTQPDR